MAADDWVILLDHTIQLGAEKLFVILGLRERTIDFGRPLQYEDLEPLWMSASAHWNGDVIREVLERLDASSDAVNTRWATMAVISEKACVWPGFRTSMM